MTDATNWKEVAIALAQRVNFAMVNCECKGGGMLNTETMKITNWRDYMAEAMEMIPNVTIDREIMATLNLPRAQRIKEQKRIREARKAEA